MEEVHDRLWRWTAYHDHWEEEVASVAVATGAGLVLIDPLEPPRELPDATAVALTVYWHVRSAASLRAPVHAATRSAQPLRNRGVADVRPLDELPDGIQAYDTARSGEVVYWIAGPRALVVGDVLLGAGAKPRATDDPLRLCPERWLGKKTHADLRRSLRPLLDLPVEQVLVAHGEPVRENGHAALARVLG